jgi:hypothetical protein
MWLKKYSCHETVPLRPLQDEISNLMTQPLHVFLKEGGNQEIPTPLDYKIRTFGHANRKSQIYSRSPSLTNFVSSQKEQIKPHMT